VWEAPPGILSTGTAALALISVVATAGGEVVFKGDVPRDPAALRPSGRISFDAPAGPIRVQVTTQNARGQKLETSDITERIPDFSAAVPQITSPQVFRAQNAYQIGLIRKAESPVPAATRVFSRSERLLVRFDAYGPGGVPPQVTMRLLSSAGAPLSDLPAPTAVSGNTFESEFSLSTFSPPGDFILEFAATSGAEKTVKLVGVRIRG